MRLFGRKPKNKIEQETNYPIVKKDEKGLGIKETENGFYGIYQLQTDDEILVTETNDRAKQAKLKLEELINWENGDVYLHIVSGEAPYEVFEEMNSIIDFYGIEKEKEDQYQAQPKEKKEEASRNGLITYKVYNSETEEYEEIEGEKLAEGLAIHKEANGEWTIDHIPSFAMLTTMPTRKMAKKCAEEMNKIITWDEKETEELFSEVKDFGDYLTKVKEAILKDEEIPEKPERLLFKMELFHLRSEKTDFKRFCLAIDKLMDMIGLDNIKQEVLDMIYSLAGKERNRGKIKETDVNFHMVFSGEPGTGKTEVARIMSEIFAALGYLPKGNLVEADRSTLVGKHVGHTAPLVKEAVEKAMGGTLFIDEAYALAGEGNDFGSEAIATLIKEMEDKKGKFVVILAGYQADMNKLLDMNEGFRSRIKNFFTFYDYTPEQVVEITQSILTHRGYDFAEGAKEEIERAIKRMAKQGKVEGNARTARNIADNIEDELNIRLGKDKKRIIEDTAVIYPQDVKLATDENAKNKKREELEAIKKKAIEKLYSLIGLNDLKKQVQRILNNIVISNMRYQNGLTSDKPRMHMMYYGPAGTGKTTVARLMGEFLKGSGMLSSGHFIEASRSDLVAGYTGQTAIKVKQLIAKAMGGVLFIDEAYALASGDSFGKEAIDTLIKEMEDHAENLVVILAGYREDMKKLLEANEGLDSRVPFHFDFPHYSVDELSEMMVMQLNNAYGLIVDEEIKKELKTYIQKEADKQGGIIAGNGRWVRNIAQEIDWNQSDRLSESGVEAITLQDLKRVKSKDIPKHA